MGFRDRSHYKCSSPGVKFCKSGLDHPTYKIRVSFGVSPGKSSSGVEARKSTPGRLWENTRKCKNLCD
jgi:hypothetical protein